MNYDWKRYWCPIGGTIRSDEKGYIFGPESFANKSLNPDLIQLETVKDVGCLILLGEPGIGKSYELKEFIGFSKDDALRHGNLILNFDLHDFSSEYALDNVVFKNPTFESWLANNSTLTLFLDSLDEGSLTIRYLANYLGMKLSQYPYERLRFRITCRPVDWPQSFTTKLQGIWGEGNTKSLELIPLRKEDIITAAISEVLVPNEFVREIENKGVVPFARKPVTLDFLLRQYKAHGKLPGNKAELYHSGCLHLCEETNKSRLEFKFRGNLSSEQRLKIAGRIAAIMMCTNHVVVSTNNERENNVEHSIKIAELAGEIERIENLEFPISENSIIEVLSTGLFSSRGENCVGFSHQTYAEYLAAWYIHEKRMPLAQIKTLILHPSDYEAKLIPQLYEIAAWLAGYRKDVFDYIAQIEPETLLRGDVTGFTQEQRRILIDALLKIYDGGNTLGNDWSIYEKLGDLIHSTLSDQLLPYINDRTKNFLARKFAIDIIERNSVNGLQNELANIALDVSEPIGLRTNAGWALVRIGGIETKARLLQLANLNPNEDPDDELRGISLLANWPHNLNSHQLFQLITPPSNDSYYGAYVDFLLHLAREINQVEIVEALKWVEKQSTEHSLSIYGELVDLIMVEAWNHIEKQEVLGLFAGIVQRKFKGYESILRRRDSLNEPYVQNFYDRLENEDIKRRSLILRLLNLINSEDDVTTLVYQPTRIIFSKDLIWLLKIFKRIKNPSQKTTIANIVLYAIDRSNKFQVEEVYKLMQKDQILKETLSPIFGPIMFDSDSAVQQKRFYYQEIEWENHRHKKEDVDTPLNERIDTFIKLGEEGDLDAWWKLNMVLNLSSDIRHHPNEREFDIKLMPGWLNSDDETKRKIIGLARNYLHQYEPDDDRWLLKDNIFYRPVNAGYRAIHLLYQESKEEVVCLPVPVWEKWASIILTYKIEYVRTGVDETSKELLMLAYKYAPAKINSILNILIDTAKYEINLSFLIRIEAILNEQFMSKLVNASISDTISNDSLATLLNFLLRKASIEAEKIGTQYIVDADRTNKGSKEKAIIAAKAFINQTPDAGWEVIWKSIIDWPEFGEDLTLDLANQWRENPPVFSKISSTQLANYYFWLVDHFPPSDDPDEKGVHSVSAREEVANFRNSIPIYLSQIGTYDGFVDLRRIVERYPEIHWLKTTLKEADIILRRNTWRAPDTQVIFSLLCAPEKRQVESGEQLLDIICESLSRLEIELQGETPSAIYLWNEKTVKDNNGKSVNVFRPKDENSLSDYIKLHLLRDIKNSGTVINREVEISRTTGIIPGEEIDIRVDAVSKDAQGDNYDVISVIIEVKGCWNDSVKSAMEDQLANRYLKDKQCRHGLYIVGAYYCKQWDDEDYRKNHCRFKDPESLRQYLSTQASELSLSGIKIRSFVLNTSLR